MAGGPVVGAGEAEPAAAAPAAAGTVVVDTTLGRMVIALDEEAAPRTVAQFRRLVAAGWYDGRPFYRVVAGHVIQAGDGGENDQPTVPGEFGLPHGVGAVGLARDEDPDSGSTEFYVCLAPRPHLDGRYAVFGQVVEGLEVLAAIGAVAVTEKWLGEGEPRVAFHEPVEPVEIERAWLAPAAP
jgi:cyclophilin family peptidyl-prolyl cis-trans isomerase